MDVVLHIEEQHDNEDGNCCYTTGGATGYGFTFKLYPPIGICVAKFEERS